MLIDRPDIVKAKYVVPMIKTIQDHQIEWLQYNEHTLLITCGGCDKSIHYSVQESIDTMAQEGVTTCKNCGVLIEIQKQGQYGTLQSFVSAFV